MKAAFRPLLPVVALVLALVLASCGGGGVAGDYEADGGKASLTLKSDDTFAMHTAKGQHITGTWTLDGAKLTMQGSGEGAIAMTVTGMVSDDELSLQFGPAATVFRRK